MGCDASRPERCGHGTVLRDNGACEIVPTSKPKNTSEIAETTNPYCSSCNNCQWSNVCSWSNGNQNDQCMKGIASFKQHGWPMPAQSQTNANRDGNYYPCCYLGDMWCKGTNQQHGKFNETIDYINKNFGKKLGFTIDKNSDFNMCKQMGCPNS